MKILLDTNAYAALKRNHEAVAERVRDAAEIVFSIVVIGELLFGFRNGSRLAQNVRELDDLLDHDRVSVIPVTRTTADRFGRIATGLRIAGRPIPSNDIWIAAHAFETGAELLSFDDHFAAVDGLVWTQLA